MDVRVDVQVETLLKIVLVLVIVWLAIEILDAALSLVLGPLKPVFGLVIVVLIVLWLVNRT